MGQITSDVTEIINHRNERREARNERQKILARMAADAEAKNNLVRKNLAAQRARFGAGGMSGTGMTEGAVLDRIRNETTEKFRDRKQTNLDRLNRIRVNRPNLLRMVTRRFDSGLGGF